MTQKKVKGKLNKELRQKAEEIVLSRANGGLLPEPTPPQIMLYELEMQNKDLITKQLELEKARDYYQQLYDFTPVACFTLDKDNIICEANLTGSHLIDIARNKLINCRFTRFIVDEDEDTFCFFKKQVMDIKQKQNCRLRMITNKGNMFYARLEGTVNNVEDRINLSVIDITQRKDRESNLHSCLYESGIIGVFYYNLDGQITDANNKFLEITGYTREDLQAGCVNWMKMTPPEYRIVDKRIVAEFKARGILGTPYEKEYIRKDGSRIPVIIGEITYDASSFEGIALMLDITRYKKVEEELKKHKEQLLWLVKERTAELQRSEENFRNSINNSPLGIRIATVDDETLYANKALLDIFGYNSVDQIKSTPLCQHYTSDSYNKYKVRKERRELGLPLPELYEVCIIDKIGNERHLRVHRRNVRWENKMEYQLIYEDITKQKRASDSVKALAQKMITIQEKERRIIARDLHDQIGQSLSAINILLKGTRGVTEQKINFKLEKVQEHIDELITMVSNLCLNLRPPMLDDLGLTDTLIWYLNRYKATTSIKVDFKHYGLDRKIDSNVAIAAYRIMQEALNNIARHADVNKAAVNIWTSKNKIHLEVEDQGVGFNLSNLAADSMIGITGMYEQAQVLGGKLKIESVPSTGTRVIAEIPLTQIVNSSKKEAR